MTEDNAEDIKSINKTEKPKMLVIKHNKLIDARYRLTQAEMNLLNLVFAEISESPNGSNGFGFDKEFTVTAEQYSKTYNIDISAAYHSLQDAAKKLFQRYISFEGQIERSENVIEQVDTRWVSEVRYNKHNGYVSLVPTRVVLEMVGRLPRDFTQQYLEHTVDLSSIYAKRLYEIMLRWRYQNNKTPKITVNELREMLGIEDNQYKQMSNFKVKVLDFAVRQINEYSNITIDYEQIKRGRTIIAFVFSCRSKKAVEPTTKTITAIQKKRLNNTVELTDTGKETDPAVIQRVKERIQARQKNKDL